MSIFEKCPPGVCVCVLEIHSEPPLTWSLELVQWRLSQASRQATLECRQKIVYKVPLVGKTIQTTHRGTGPGVVHV